MNLRRTIASVFVAVALLGAGFVPAASADAPALPAKSSASAPKSSKTKVTSKPSTVTNKTKFTVKGKVSPARKGAVVELQRLNGKKKWVKVASTRTSSSGAYKLSAKISRTSSSATLRVATKKTAKYASSATGRFRVEILTKKAAKAVAVAKKQVGKRYRYGATGPSAFDCSGLTSYAYKSAGVKLSHSARTQSRNGKKVAKKDLQAGDLVFFYAPISHVGIYIGNGKIVHAGSSRTGVEIAKLSWMPYSGARRVG